MKLLIAIMIAVAQLGYCYQDQRYDKHIEQKIYESGFYIGDLEDLASMSVHAITNIVKVSSLELRKKGHRETAEMIEVIWKHYDDKLLDLGMGKRDIGWFEPISDGLSLIYELTEQQLGYDVCHALRIDDIKTINHALRVAFQPCYYGLDEYYKHMVKDPKYRGLLPVLTYWTVVIGCSYATYGIGYVIICSPAAYVIEKVVQNRIAPKVVNRIYEAACSI